MSGNRTASSRANAAAALASASASWAELQGNPVVLAHGCERSFALAERVHRAIDHVRIDDQPRNEGGLTDAQTFGMHDRQIVGGVERYDSVIARPGIVQSLANLFVALGVVLAVLRRVLGADAVNGRGTGGDVDAGIE